MVFKRSYFSINVTVPYLKKKKNRFVESEWKSKH